jgi:hypothetical protein
VTPATALVYHRLTSVEPGREDDPEPFVRGWVTPGDHPLLVHGFVLNVVENWPAACKTYPEGLPRPGHLSAGVVRVLEREGRPRVLFRAAGSAGGRFPSSCTCPRSA